MSCCLRHCLRPVALTVQRFLSHTLRSFQDVSMAKPFLQARAAAARSRVLEGQLLQVRKRQTFGNCLRALVYERLSAKPCSPSRRRQATLKLASTWHIFHADERVGGCVPCCASWSANRTHFSEDAATIDRAIEMRAEVQCDSFVNRCRSSFCAYHRRWK